MINIKFPLILLFDNELNVKGKPLNVFASFARLTEDQKKELSEHSCLQLIPESNLYLAAIPLPEGKKECEIEDLYDDTALQTVIGGKHFDRKAGSGDKNHYGKEVFAQHMSKRTDVDFSGFKGLLDIIAEICRKTE